jgi:hypothetical protein
MSFMVGSFVGEVCLVGFHNQQQSKAQDGYAESDHAVGMA